MSRYDDEIDDHMRHNENPGTSNQPPMPDNMKGLLDKLKSHLLYLMAEVKGASAEDAVQEQMDNLSSLRTAVEKMGHEATLGVGDGSGNLFVHGSYDSIKQCQALILSGEKAERELKGAHVKGCRCAGLPHQEGALVDPRCLALRKGK